MCLSECIRVSKEQEWCTVLMIYSSALSLNFWPYMGRHYESSHSPLGSAWGSAPSISPLVNTSHIWSLCSLSYKLLLETEEGIKKRKWIKRKLISDTSEEERNGKGAFLVLVYCSDCWTPSGSMRASAFAFTENTETGGLSACCSDSGNPCLLL